MTFDILMYEQRDYEPNGQNDKYKLHKYVMHKRSRAYGVNRAIGHIWTMNPALTERGAGPSSMLAAEDHRRGPCGFKYRGPRLRTPPAGSGRKRTLIATLDPQTLQMKLFIQRMSGRSLHYFGLT